MGHEHDELVEISRETRLKTARSRPARNPAQPATEVRTGQLVNAGIPTVEHLGVRVIDDDGRANSIQYLIGGTTSLLLEWVYLSLDGAFFNVRTAEQITKASFDTSMAVHTPAVQFVGDTVQKRYPASRVLLEYLKGPSVYAAMYRPDVDALIFEHDGKQWVNSGLQARLPVPDPDWRVHEAWKIVRDHIRNIFPGEPKLLVQWIAHNAQNPGKKILWSPVLVGVQGDGKTLIASTLLKAVLGSHVGEASPEEIFSDFSDWAADKAVRVIEEIRIVGERRSAAMDKLKPKITNTSVRITPKGAKGRDVANVTNYILCSNHHDALAITIGDRRYGVWKTRFPSREAMLSERSKEEWAAYWRRLHAAINDHPDVIRAWLLNVNLSDFDPHDAPPINVAKLGMIKAAKSSTASEVQEAIELGGEGIRPAVLDTICLNARIKELSGQTVNTKALQSILDEAGWSKHELTVKWRAHNRRLYYRADEFPNLAGLDLSRELRRHLDRPESDDDRNAELSSDPVF